MVRINQILHHAEYQKNLEEIAQCESKRVFCKHDMGHFLDVARIAQLMNLKERLDLSEELIYATALLHDIGRHKQYIEGIPHEKASIPIAEEILGSCGFDQNEIEIIRNAIKNHRTSESKNMKDLTGIIYRADKLSRPCFCCPMEYQCNWTEDKKNRSLLQ